MLRLLLLVASAVGGRACDSVAVLPFATADGLGALYGKNADRQYKEAQPVAAMPRMTHPAGAIITLDSGLKIPQVPLTYAHAGSRPNWAHPCASDATPHAVLTAASCGTHPPPACTLTDSLPLRLAAADGGYSEGVNEWGVGLGNEHFYTHRLPSDDGVAPQAEFTDLTRLVLERTKTAAEAVALLTQLISEYGQTCQTCPVLANYNSMFMVTDSTSVYSVMAVGHEWGYKEIKPGDQALNGTGVWTISNCYFTGTTNHSYTAISTARKYLGYTGTDAAFSFGEVYGTTACDARQSRQVRSQAFLRDLSADHKLTKADLMLTLSDHEHGGDVDQPYVAMPSRGATIDWHASHAGGGTISASSMVSDFSTDGLRKIVWHTGPNPCMAVSHLSPLYRSCCLLPVHEPHPASLTLLRQSRNHDVRSARSLSCCALQVYYPVFFFADGHISTMPAFLSDGSAWYAFRYVIYELAKEDPVKIKTVQDTWRPIQLQFFRQAENAAVMAAQMRDVASAEALLSKVLDQISETIRLTLVHLNNTLVDDASSSS
jgi:hypothetical protein